MRTPLLIVILLLAVTKTLIGQNCQKPTVFTWEGAQKGNKAVWKADDISNTYTNIGGIDVKVSILDPYGQNTTTVNPSEFGDYTKSNTFFGNGSLAFQITAQKSNQPVCLEYEFSKNIILDHFDVWDIDFIAHLSRPEGTFQDSFSFIAYDKFGEVPLVLSPMGRAQSYTIYQQSVFSGYNPLVNGDLNHRDSIGALRVSSIMPINKFVLCYANGSRDDGVSNSQAARISSFGFCEYLGSISGSVLEDVTFIPLGNVNVRLLKSDGAAAVDGSGLPFTTTTDANGYYQFLDMPMGDYIISIVSPEGYHSSRDVDDSNDNKIDVSLDTHKNIVIDRNFYQVANSPLPVRLVDFQATNQGFGNINVNWQTTWERNNDYFTISTSADGINYNSRGNISSHGSQSSKQNYSFMLHEVQAQKVVYIALEQTDYDGKTLSLGARKVLLSGQSDSWSIWPNPVDNHLNLQGELNNADMKVEILNTAGQQLSTSTIDSSTPSIDVSHLERGLYFVRVSDEVGSQVMRFVKK